MKPTKPLDFGVSIRKLYIYMFFLMTVMTFVTALEIEFTSVLFFSKIVCASIVVLFSLVVVSTNLLLNSLNKGIRKSLDSFNTAEFTEIELFWRQANEFAIGKVISFGGILGMIVLVEYVTLLS